jgi:hypothetical protein
MMKTQKSFISKYRIVTVGKSKGLWSEKDLQGILGSREVFFVFVFYFRVAVILVLLSTILSHYS